MCPYCNRLTRGSIDIFPSNANIPSGIIGLGRGIRPNGGSVRIVALMAALTATGFMAGAPLAHADAAAPMDRVSLNSDTLFAPLPSAANGSFNFTRLSSVSSAFVEGGSATIDFGNTVHISVAQATFDPPRDLFALSDNLGVPQIGETPLALAKPQARLSSASVDWNFTDWGSLGLTAMDSEEPVGLLGPINATPLTPVGLTRASALALSAHVSLGDGWVTTVSYGVGISQLNRKTAASISTGTVRGGVYGLAVAKHGLFGDADALGLSVTHPVETYEGKVDLSGVSLTASGGDNYSLLGDRAFLPGSTPQTDVELGYVTTFFGGALALQANAGYQMNVVGQSGVNSVSVLSRAKINF